MSSKQTKSKSTLHNFCILSYKDYYLAFLKISGNILYFKTITQNKIKKKTSRRGLEPRSKAPQASRISSTLPGPVTSHLSALLNRTLVHIKESVLSRFLIQSCTAGGQLFRLSLRAVFPARIQWKGRQLPHSAALHPPLSSPPSRPEDASR